MLEPSERLRRVLGPRGPELTCDQCFEELDHYVELRAGGGDPDSKIPALRAHLEGCPACAEDYASLLALVETEADS